MKKIGLVILVLILLVTVLTALSYSNRAIKETDKILITDVNDGVHLNKWSQVKNFIFKYLDGVDGNFTIGGDLIVEGEFTDAQPYVMANITTAGDTVSTDTLNIYRTIDAPFTNREIYEFTATDSGIIYTGEKTRIFEINCAISYTTDKSANVITHAIELNDTLCVASAFPFKTQTAGYYGSAQMLISKELQTNDRVELVVKSDKADTNIYYQKYNTSIKTVR